MSSNENYAYRAYIKDIYIELPEYQFNHSPLGKNNLQDSSEDEKELFIGRKQIEDKFLNILLESGDNKSGSYLVTGYRGMGKTSFVKRVINNYKQKAERNKFEKIEKIDISFAQSDLNEADILKQITNNLIQRAEENRLLKIADTFSLGNVFRLVSFFLIFLTLIYFLFYFNYTYNKTTITDLYVSKDSTIIHPPLSKKNDSTYTKKYKLRDTTIANTSSSSPSISPIDRFLFNLKNPIKDILDKSNEHQLSSLLFYLVLLAVIGLVITYLLKILYNILIFFIKFEEIKIKDFIIYSIILVFVPFGVTFLLSQPFCYDFILIKNLTYTIIFLIIASFLILYRIGKITTNSKFWTSYYYEKIIGEYKIYRKLKTLQERSNASITNEQGIQSVSEQLPLGFIQRKVKQYAIKNPKEIEYELIAILQEYGKFKNYKKRFIIVFDELDKVEPSLGKGFYHDDFDPTEQSDFSQNKTNESRNRKKIIINILSTLKYFITSADAKFVFIAGREMFDAALADIADRESFISSIFHHIIYVDSFLKDPDSNEFRAKGVTGLVDVYLEKILIPSEARKKINKKFSFLKNYYNYIKNIRLNDNKLLTEEQCLKTIYVLQNFVIYLTYRSSGSPKKLTKLIEEHIVSCEIKSENWTQWKNNELKLIVHSQEQKGKRVLFLFFPYKQQYRFGFVSYIFRPFILAQSQVIKKYSDTVLVSTPYLIDHIIKFHPFAFSVENLELIPEIIASNRNPMFRFFIEELIKYLRTSHIRETELGLFDYKFFSKTSNEITYISKIFEDELAAFNFSLDEMYSVKQHVQTKIKNIRSNYNQLNTGENSDGKNVIYSIAFLNNLLGDTQYFDQEYDNALVAYLDGLQLIRECSKSTFESIYLTIKVKLKIGLIYEKMKNNSMALSYFNDAVMDIKRYITIELNINNQKEENSNTLILKNSTKFISHSEILQIANLPYAASLYLQEKHNVEGINFERLNNYSKDFEKIVNLIEKKDGKNNIVLADHYNDLGNLLYYKNYISDSQIKEENEVDFLTFITNDFKKGVLIKSKYYNKDFRASFESYNYYNKAIQILLETKGGGFFNQCKKGAEKIRVFENIYSKTFLKTLAFSFSNAGNFLFSIIKNNQKNTLSEFSILWKKRIELKNIFESFEFDIMKKDDELESILKKINKEIENESEKSLILTFFESEFNYLKQSNNLICKYYIEQFKSFDRPMVFWDIITHHYFSYKSELLKGNQLDCIIFVYYLSGRFYSKIGKNVSFSFQLRKVLQIIRNANCFENESKDNNKTLIDFLEESLLKMILEATSWNSSSTDRPQIYKFKYIEENNDIFHPKIYSKHNYANISNNPETKEAIFFMADLKVRAFDFSKEMNSTIEGFMNIIPEMHLVHPYNGISSQFSRIQELDLQTKINQVLLKKIFPKHEEWEGKSNRKESIKEGENGFFKIHKRQRIISKKVAPSKENDELTKSIKYVNFVDKNFKYNSYIDDIINKLNAKSNINDELKTILKKINNTLSLIKNNLLLGNDLLKGKEAFKNLSLVHFVIDIFCDKDFFGDYKKITANSIFSLIQIINIIKLYGINPYLSYSYLAYFQSKLAKWLKHYELCEIYDYSYNIPNNDTIKYYLENMIGYEAMVTLDATSQFQIALQYYHKAKQMHSNGIAYHQEIENFIYLEGDFDDNLYHFGTALERQKINSHKIRDMIKNLEKELETSPLYVYESYVNTETNFD